MKLICLDQFLYRKTSRSFDEDRVYLDSGDLVSWLSLPGIKTILSSTGSKFISKVLADVSNGKPLTEADKSTLVKYLIRTGIRPTPRGLFAGVGVGHLADQFLLPDKFQNMDWIYRSVIEQKDTLVCLNPTIEFFADHLGILQTDLGLSANQSVHRNRNQWIYIRIAPPVLEWLKSKQEFPIERSGLVRQFRNAFPNISSAKADRVVQKLIENQVLQLRRPSQIEFSHRSLSGFDQVTGQDLGKDFSGFTFKENLVLKKSVFERIANCLSDLVPLYREAHSLSLPSNIKAISRYLEQNSAINFLPLSEITASFLVAYKPPEHKINNNQLSSYLLEKIHYCQGQQIDVWDISKEEMLSMKALCMTSSKMKPLSGVGALLVGFGERQRPEFYLQALVSNSTTRLSSRYYHWHSEHSDLLEKIWQAELKFQESDQPVHLRYPEIDLGLESLAGDTDFGGHEIRFDSLGFNSKRLGEIGFSFESKNGLVLVDRTSNKRLVPMLPHAMKLRSYDPIAYQVLADFSQMHAVPTHLFGGTLANLVNEAPRITYKGFVISKRSWKITVSELKISALDLQIKRRLPMDFYVVDEGIKIYVDLRYKWGIQLFEELQKKHSRTKFPITIEENLPGETSLGLEVNAFFMNNTKPVRKLRAFNPSLVQPISPFSKTPYWKIYGDPKKFNAILCNLDQSKILKRDDWFFIRYSDPNPHLRVRYGFKAKVKMSSILKMDKILRDLQSKNLVHEIQFSYYQPELDRYKGMNGLRLFERISCVDSLMYLDQYQRSEFRPTEEAKQALWFWLNVLFDDFELRQKFLSETLKNQKVKGLLSLDIYGQDKVNPFDFNIWFSTKDILRAQKFIRSLDWQDQFDYGFSILHMIANRRGLHSGFSDQVFFKFLLQFDRQIHFRKSSVL